MKDMILFSQAPADIQYVISLYDKYKDSYKIKIIVVNVENSYKFYKSLQLSAEIFFVPLVGQSQIVNFLLYSFKLKTKYQDFYADIFNAEVYFFSNNYDYVTAFFVEKLKVNNSIYFYNIYNIDGETVNNASIKLKTFLMRVLFGIKVRFFKLPPNIAYQYVFDKVKVKEIAFNVEEERLKKYKYIVNQVNNNKKNILFFESNGDNDSSFVNYTRDLSIILDKLSLDYNIYIKPHPRLGHSAVLKKYNVKFIPNYIPSELVSMINFVSVFGIDSTSIATSIHPNKYSLIELFEFNDEERKEYLIKYLDGLSNKKLKYIKNIKIKEGKI